MIEYNCLSNSAISDSAIPQLSGFKQKPRLSLDNLGLFGTSVSKTQCPGMIAVLMSPLRFIMCLSTC